MTKKHTTCVCITATSINIPASATGRYPKERLLAGIGLLVARRDRKDRWRFDSHAYALAAGEPEGALLQWAADLLPAESLFVGWQIDRVLMPSLLEAAEDTTPDIAGHFLGRLYRLLRGGAIDLSLEHGGMTAGDLRDVAAELAIFAPARDATAIFTGWALGQVERHRRDLGDEALTMWQIFLLHAGLNGLDAEAATIAWMRRSRQLRPVNSADSAA